MVRAAMMMMVVLVAAAPMFATTLRSYSPEDIIQNPRTWSANEQFCLIWREYPNVPDFGSVRADTIFDFSEDEGYRLKEPESARITGALYTADRRLVGTITIERHQWAQTFVADSGLFVVITPWHEELASTDTCLAIYRFDRQRVDDIEAGRIFTPRDLAEINRIRDLPDVRLAVEEGREIAVLQVEQRVPGPPVEIRIDLATATRLGEMRDMYPAPRVWLTPAGFVPPHRRHTWTPTDCKEVPPAARIASKQLHARAVSLPLPPYPTVAWKARVAGTVWVELTVSETGKVLCSRAIGLPFGMTEAALAAARTWKFEPYLIGGAPVKFTSALELHFAFLNEMAWREVTQNREP